MPAEVRDTGDMAEIVVEVHDPADPPVSESFTGRWLVRPGRREARTGEMGCGECWGVAQTWRGNIAVYNADADGGWAELAVYPSLDAAAHSACVPADILALAAAELGQERAGGAREGLQPVLRVRWRLGPDGVMRADI